MASTTSIENIFDDDVQIESPRQSFDNESTGIDDASLPRRSRQPLFLADSDEEMDVDVSERNVLRPPPPNEIDIDDIFGDLGDLDEDFFTSNSSAPLDEEAMIREAEARIRKTTTLHEILPSSSPVRNMTEERMDKESTKTGKKTNDKSADSDEKKAKRRVMKLDENRLLGPSGFPQLIKMTKDFKIKGKGHEAYLNRLLQVYQFWTHQLYPKTPFKDTVERIEKLTHSRRMNVSLSVWKDEAKGIQPQQDSDESEAEDEQGENQSILRESERASSSRSSPLPSSSPPLSPRIVSNGTTTSRASDGDNGSRRGDAEPLFLNDDDDEALWNAMAEFEAETAPAPPPPISANNSSMDDDDDLWDMANEMHAESSTTQLPQHSARGVQNLGHIQQPPPAPPDDDDDDMYV
ncbi:hypothetical protein CVT24_005923 [Panaeolus cyanescens]|uniref:Chromosome segregation in meiosis protein n=1 Tax=Panaeolus cyanescens TaxID=181874 RepID=A0A409V8Y1_9AGAR|nr:hypothetical protein CVT24_005923 [Panaeolus cyanescens]